MYNDVILGFPVALKMREMTTPMSGCVLVTDLMPQIWQCERLTSLSYITGATHCTTSTIPNLYCGAQSMITHDLKIRKLRPDTNFTFRTILENSSTLHRTVDTRFQLTVCTPAVTV
jgi:hypothetical protein